MASDAPKSEMTSSGELYCCCCHHLALASLRDDHDWQRSAGGRLLSFRIWSTHLLRGRPGWWCHWLLGGCCCDSPAALLLSSVVQVEEVCNRSRVVAQVLHCKLRRMALTVEQMLYGVWCHSTLRTDVWYAAGNAGLVTVQKPAVTGTQLGESGMDCIASLWEDHEYRSEELWIVLIGVGTTEVTTTDQLCAY